jgi:hypothetical protein
MAVVRTGGNVSGSARGDDSLLVLPFYLVVDVSYSMYGEPIAAVNQILPEVIDTVEQSPTLGDLVRFGVIDFSDHARVVLPLTDLRDVTAIPTLEVRGGTSYAAAFRLLKQEIERDLATLKSGSYRVYRPAVFFMTDGQPTDSDEAVSAAFGELISPSFRARPNILPFGVSDSVSKQALDPWVFPRPGSTGKAMRSFIYTGEGGAAEAIPQFTEILVSSVVASANSVTTTGTAGGFVLPDDEDLDGWI